MNCCINCFKDEQIRAVIKSKKTKGNCDFCNHQKTYIYDLDAYQELTDMFTSLLDIYSPKKYLPKDFPTKYLNLLKDELYHTWLIFSIDEDKVNLLIKAICKEMYDSNQDLFNDLVGIQEFADESYIEENSLLNGCEWKDFVKSIKSENRFHTDHINEDILGDFFSYASISYKKNDKFYRSRICENEKGFNKKDMGCPPPDKALGGRANPTGISYLYLSDSVYTTIYEIRASIYDYVAVSEFYVAKENLKVVDFTKLTKISPFAIDNILRLAINIKNLEDISSSISKPLRRYDSPLDYLATQYISDFIKSKKYSGIQYYSTINKDGFNLAIFNEHDFTRKKPKVYEVKGIEYLYEKI